MVEYIVEIVGQCAARIDHRAPRSDAMARCHAYEVRAVRNLATGQTGNESGRRKNQNGAVEMQPVVLAPAQALVEPLPIEP